MAAAFKYLKGPNMVKVKASFRRQMLISWQATVLLIIRKTLS